MFFLRFVMLIHYEREKMKTLKIAFAALLSLAFVSGASAQGNPLSMEMTSVSSDTFPNPNIHGDFSDYIQITIDIENTGLQDIGYLSFNLSTDQTDSFVFLKRRPGTTCRGNLSISPASVTASTTGPTERLVAGGSCRLVVAGRRDVLEFLVFEAQLGGITLDLLGEVWSTTASTVAYPPYQPL